MIDAIWSDGCHLRRVNDFPKRWPLPDHSPRCTSRPSTGVTFPQPHNQWWIPRMVPFFVRMALEERDAIEHHRR